MRKIICLVISLVIVFCGGVYAADFSDLPKEHWAYANVMNLVKQGVINGYPDGTYNPSGQVTRAEFFKLISVATEGEEYFEKLGKNNGEWYLPYANYLFDNCYVMDGTDEEEMNVYITREEMATCMAKVIIGKDINTPYLELDDNVEVPQVQSFTDLNDLKEESQLYIKKIANLRLITGYEDGSFRPNNNLTRAEVATVITRFLISKQGDEQYE